MALEARHASAKKVGEGAQGQASRRLALCTPQTYQMIPPPLLSASAA